MPEILSGWERADRTISHILLFIGFNSQNHSRMSISTGLAAPDFSLFDTEKKKITLSQLEGSNVLLLFFPQAFTGVCTRELCSIRDNLNQYTALDARILAISVDSIFTLAKFKEEQQYNFPLLSDFNKEVSALYGTLYDTFVFDMKGVSKRSAFLIDRKGIIRYAEVLENAGEEPDFKAIQDVLTTLQ
jgi:peroxiredoxin